MATLREQIVVAMVAAVNAGSIGATAYRSRTEALSRAQSPALIIEPVSDSAQQNVVPKLDWTLTVRGTLVVRGPAADVAADPIVQATHAALLADMTYGGLAMTTLPSTVQYQFSDADGGVCVVTMDYRVQYRTSEQDLTVQ